MKSKIFMIIIFILFLLTSFIPQQVETKGNVINEEIIIDCIIIYSSGCPLCYETYKESILPFYSSYQNNSTLNFTLIDIYSNMDYFLRTLVYLDIESSNYGNLPWVIFAWGEKQYVVLDESNLDMIEFTFHAILDDPEYTWLKNYGSLFESIDFSILVLAVMITLIGLVLVITAFYIYQKIWNTDILLKRISKRRFLLLTFFSIISIIVLVYQLIDHYRGGCGCLTGNLIRSIIFRKYDHVHIFNLEIPFALIGFILMIAILIQVSIIGFFPLPLNFQLLFNHPISITSNNFKFTYYFLVFQVLCAFLFLFYLLYLELFVIEFICLLCTISQVIIIINTILIVTWNPFK